MNKQQVLDVKQDQLPPPSPTTRKKKDNADVQSVWDVNKQAWRSFRWDHLIEVNNVPFVMETEDEIQT